MGTSLRSQYEPKVIAAARKYGVPADVFARMIAQESGNYDSDVISGNRLSSAGAQGIAQFMPATARGLGVDPFNPDQAIEGAARYFRQMIDYFGGDVAKGAAAYNAGPGRVAETVRQGGSSWFDYLPAETQSYLGPGGKTYRKDAQSAPVQTSQPVSNQTTQRSFSLPVEGQISQGFGPTSEKLDSGWAGHANFNKGYDIAVPVGTPVKSMTNGTVIDVGDKGDGWGTRVWVRDTEGNIHNYGHLSGYGVEPGQTVRAGQVIASSGNTGKSTGPHLSWDVWRETPNGPQYFDYLQAKGGRNMVMGNGQVGGGAARAPGSADAPPSKSQLLTDIWGQIQAYKQLPPDDQDPNVLNQLYARYTAALQADEGTGADNSLTPFQAGQLGNQEYQNAISAAAEARANRQQQIENYRNWNLDQVAAGTLKLQDAVANVNRFVSLATMAEQQAQNDIENEVTLAAAAVPEGTNYQAGFDPGGPLQRRLARYGKSVPTMAMQTTNIDPAAARAAAMERYGVSGPPPTIEGARGDIPVFDPSNFTPTDVPIGPPSSSGMFPVPMPSPDGSVPAPSAPGQWTRDENGNWVGSSAAYPDQSGMSPTPPMVTQSVPPPSPFMPSTTRFVDGRPVTSVGNPNISPMFDILPPESMAAIAAAKPGAPGLPPPAPNFFEQQLPALAQGLTATIPGINRVNNIANLFGRFFR